MKSSSSVFLAAALCLAAGLGAQTNSQTSKRPGTQDQEAATSQSTRAQTRTDRGREFLGLGPVPDAAAAARGQKIFASTCGFCHGSNATGAEGPNLIRSTLVLHDEKGELIGPFLHNGRPDRGMPAFPNLTDAQTYDIAEFLHQRVEDTTNRFGYKIQNVVTGNAAEGKAFFDQHCNKCHSATGDLAHIASSVEPADLQALFLYPSQSINAKGEKTTVPVQVSVTLASGESISGTLKRIDDFNVSMYDGSGMYHSWPRSEVKVDIKDPLAAHRELLGTYTDADMHNILAYLVTLK
ncbi:MAG: c-type cytochrome [Acidobacteriaceae bacterium]|nr:c-type cytochrome [Acidobacteriaceae bacterium]